MNVDPGRIKFEPLVLVEGLWLSPSFEFPLPRAARKVYSGFVLQFPDGLPEDMLLRIGGAHYHQGNDADHKPTTGEEKTPTHSLQGKLTTPQGEVIANCDSCRTDQKLQEGQDQLRINAIDDEHDFLTLKNSSARIKIKTTCSPHKGKKKVAFVLHLWIVNEQDGSIVAQGEHTLGKVIANAAKRRRCKKTAAAQGEPPKKRRRTKAASRQPPPPGPTASAPTSPASAAGRLQFRPIRPAPDLDVRAFQPLPGAPWLPLGQPPPPSVAQAQAHADPTQSPVPSCGGTSSPAPSPSPSPVDSCVDMSPISIELGTSSNRGFFNLPEAAETCANESPEDEYNDLGPDLLDFHPDFIAEMWRFESENALKC